MSYLKKYHRFILSLFIFFYKKPKITISFSIIILVLGLFFSQRLQFLVMVGDLLDTNFETYAQFNNLNSGFIEENNVSLIITTKDQNKNITKEEHCKLIDWMNNVATENNKILKIVSTYGVRTIGIQNQKLKLNPILIDNCKPENLSNNEEVSKQLQLIQEHPSGVYLTSKRANDVMILFYIEGLKKTSTFGSFDIQAVQRIRDSFDKNFTKEEFNLKPIWSGAGTYQFYLQKAYLQMLVVNLLTALIALLLFRYFFGNWFSGILFLATIGFTLVILYGIMGYLKFPTDSISSAVPIMLMLSTLEDFVYILFLQKKGMTWRRSVKKLLFPAFGTSFTTFIGFASLGFVDLQIISRFGIICAIGAMIEWVVVFLILPSVLNFFNFNKYWVKQSVNNQFLSKISNVTIPKKIVLSSLVIFVISILGINKLNISDSPEEIFPQSHPVPKASEYLLESRGWKSEISLVFPDFINNETKQSITEEIKQKNNIIKFSESSEDIFRGSIVELDENETQLIYQYWKDSSFSDRWISKINGNERVILFSNTSNVVDIDLLRKSINAICKERCYPANILVSYSEFGIRTLKALIESFAGSIFFVTLFILLLCFGFNIKNKTSLILSTLWGPFALLSVFVIFKIEIFFATSVVMSVLVALAGDNAIQYIYGRSKGDITKSIDNLSQASIICTLIMMGISLCFLFSDFAGVQKIGLMMFVGFILILIGDLYLLRGFLNLNFKSFLNKIFRFLH